MQFYIDELDEPEPFISTLSIASCQFDTCTKDQAYKLAKTLGELSSTQNYMSHQLPIHSCVLLCNYHSAMFGFIHLTFDLRMKFRTTKKYVYITTTSTKVCTLHKAINNIAV